MHLDESRVTVQFTRARHYGERPPYDPPQPYPEYQGRGVDAANPIYGDVRATLARHGLDGAHFGTAEWNPLGTFIRPGMTVFIKPNTVSHVNLAGADLFAVIIHASLLRPVLDYVCRALAGQGRIIIGDSQIINSDFDLALERAGIAALLDWYRGQTPIPIECFDLRLVRGVRTWLYGRWGRRRVEQDPRGYRTVDLGRESYFEGIDPRRLRTAVASYKVMRHYHAAGRHQYVIPRSFLESDVVISLPKLKTHRRTAITIALKNYMGIPALKDSLPHFITGAPAAGGDQYIHPSRRKELCLWLHDQIQSNPLVPVKFACALAKKLVWNSSRIVPFKDDVYEAMWAGNDTIWRTLLDLNRIVRHADKAGRLQPTAQRVQFHLVDGIIGGQGDGPLSPQPVPAGVLLAGADPTAVDATAATLMGFDFRKIPLITQAFADRTRERPVCALTPEQIRIAVEQRELDLAAFADAYNLGFAPHPNWAGQIERPARATAVPVAGGAP